MRWSLFSEIVAMSWDTVRGNKMRSFLTVLGIVIGITSIVGMTAMIRGFDQSIRDLTRCTWRRCQPSASRRAPSSAT
jgi:ABC-type lipoprotein release transport system permease subunit